MTTLLRTRPRPIRSVALIGCAVLVAVASYVGASELHAPGGASAPAVAPEVSAPGDGDGGRAVGGGSALGGGSNRVALPDGPLPGADPAIARLDRAISVWTLNLKADGADFISATNLAYDQYSRGRLTGDVEDYARAEEAVQMALGAFPANTGARALDAVIRAAVHDFAGAYAEASSIYSSDHGQLQALATMGDAALELGRYDEAEASYRALATQAPGAAITARLAHLAQLRGQTDEALRLAQAAAAQAVTEGSTGPALAWYRALTGSIAFQSGRLPDAETAFRAALVDWPASYAALVGLGRTLAAEDRFDEAIDALGRAIAIIPQPESLATLGDLYALTGQPDLARRQYDTVRLIATLGAIQRQVYDRILVLFDADHGTDVDEAVRLATAELAVRKDVYGWDSLAWALLADGRPSDADAAMSHALALGTQDAMLDYHAGMIAAALHDTSRARVLLSAALRLNAGFQLLQAARARQALEALGGMSLDAPTRSIVR